MSHTVILRLLQHTWAYLRLCPEKWQKKKNLVDKRLKLYMSHTLNLPTHTCMRLYLAMWDTGASQTPCTSGVTRAEHSSCTTTRSTQHAVTSPCRCPPPSGGAYGELMSRWYRDRTSHSRVGGKHCIEDDSWHTNLSNIYH